MSWTNRSLMQKHGMHEEGETQLLYCKELEKYETAEAKWLRCITQEEHNKLRLESKTLAYKKLKCNGECLHSRQNIATTQMATE